MRKRSTQPSATAPKACGHPDITVDGNSAPACMWGRPETFPIPSGAEGATMREAHFEHFYWDWSSGRSILRVRPEMLGPDGQPFDFTDKNGRHRPMWVTG